MASGEKIEITAATRGDTPSTYSSTSPAYGNGQKQQSPDHHDLDQAYWYVQQSNNAAEATPSELAALRRKIDWRIVPIMFCCYTMQFIDKVSLNVRYSRTRDERRSPLTRSVCRCHGIEQRAQIKVQ